MARDVLEQRTGGWADGSWSARPWAGGSIVDGTWLGGLSEVDQTDVGNIELGEAGPVADAPAPAKVSRARVATILAAVCLFVLSGATPTRTVEPALLWTVQLAEPGRIAASGDILYVSPPGSAPPVTALDLRTGRTLWRVDVPWTPQRFLDLGNGLDAVVVRTSIVDPAEPSYDLQTVFVRRDDGRVVAEANGEPVQWVGRLLLQIGSVRRCPEDPTFECAAVSAVDPTTGQTTWQMTLPPNGRVLAGGRGSGQSFITAGADGGLTLRSALTGQPLVRIPGTLTSGGGLRLSTVVGDMLVVGVAGTDDTELTGYRAGTLERVWTARLPRDSGSRQVDTSLVALSRCGEAACVADGGGTAVLDATTGALRFRTPLEVVARIAGGPLIAVPHLGHLDSTGRYVSDVLALDPSSGRVLTTVADATLVESGDGPAAAVGLVSRVGPRGVRFAAMAADAHTVALLTVAGTGLTCLQHARRLVCLDDAGDLRAWNI